MKDLTEIPEGMYLIMKNRSHYYRLLTEFFKNPVNEDLLLGLSKESFGGITQNQFENYPELEEGIELIHNFVCGSDSEKLIQKIKEDYENIFKTDFKPKESQIKKLNNSDKKNLKNNLINCYEENEYEFKEEFDDLNPDHFLVETSFMLHLTIELRKEIINRNPEKVKNLFLTSNDFFNNYVINWFPEFADEIYKRCSIDYYKGGAKLIKSFVELDKDVFPLFLEKFNKK